MAEDLKNVPLYKSKYGLKRKDENDDIQIIRRVSSRLTECQKVRQNEDDNIEIIRHVASRLTECQKARQKENDRNKTLNIINSLRNRAVPLGYNDKAHLKSHQHKIPYTGQKNCKRLILLDCKVGVKKLNLNKLKSVKNEMYCIYDHKTENLKLSTENEKLCLDKTVSKGLSLLNCKVMVNKLNVINLKSVKNKNYHVSDDEKEELKQPSQNEKLPFDRRVSKGLVKRKPKLDLSKCDTSTSNSNQNDLPDAISEHNWTDTDLVTEYESESVINKSTAEIKTEQVVLESNSAAIEKNSKPDITPYLESNNNNNLDQKFASKVKTEIINKPDESVSQTVSLYNYSSSGVSPDLSSKQTYLLSNLVPEKLVSEIKKEPVEQLSDPSNISNKTICGSPEYFDREKHANFTVKQEIVDNQELDKEFYNSRTIDKPLENNVSTSNLEQNLKKIKSEPKEISSGTQTNTIKGTNIGKIKGAVALRERLIMYTSEKIIKQEPLKVDELKENANELTCNPDQKNKDPTNLHSTKIDDTEVKESINNTREKQSNEVGDAILPSCSQNGIVVDGNGYLSNSEYNIEKNCHKDLAPLPIKQFALNHFFNTKPDAIEVKEKSNNFRSSIQSGIVVDNYNCYSDYQFVKNWFADLVPIPGLPHKRCSLSVVLGYNHIQTLVSLEKFIFLNGIAIQCKWIDYPIKVQFDGIWNKKEGKFIVFVIWNGIKPRININQLFRFPMAVDYFDVQGKCTSFDKILKIHIDKFDLTLQCLNITSSFLNGNKKSLLIPVDSPVNLYLRRYSSSDTEPKWTILWMILYKN